MKRLYQILFGVLALGLFGCSDDDSISIDSLSTDGDEFYCNQKVKVWMCVNSSDLWHTTYKWECDGGEFTQPQGLNEETWKAPNVPGTYTITCTATVGGKSQTRSHRMYVSSYFFEKFEKSSQSSFTLQNGKSSIIAESDGNHYLRTTVNSSTEPTRYIRRAFGDDMLVTPFSCRAKVGFVSNMPTTKSITVGKKTANAVMEYRVNMRSDVSNENNLINYVSLQWYPGKPKDGYPTLTDGTTVEGTADWNVRLAVQHTAASGIKTTNTEYHNMNTMNVFANKSYHTVALGIDNSETVHVFVDGVEVLTSTLLHDTRTEMGCPGSMFINTWDIYQLNGNGGRNLPQFYLDDAYASNIDEMLK